MNDYTATVPLVQSLSLLIKVLLLFSTLLIGGVIFFAWQTLLLRRHIAELEKTARAVTNREQLEEESPLSDDQPIPTIRHRFGDAKTILNRQRTDRPEPNNQT